MGGGESGIVNEGQGGRGGRVGREGKGGGEGFHPPFINSNHVVGKNYLELV